MRVPRRLFRYRFGSSCHHLHEKKNPPHQGEKHKLRPSTEVFPRDIEFIDSNPEPWFIDISSLLLPPLPFIAAVRSFIPGWNG